MSKYHFCFSFQHSWMQCDCGGGNFQQIVKKLNLIPADTSLTEPSNAGYVFNGAYNPLTCRLVEEVLKAGGDVSNSPVVGELLKLLPGESVIEWSGNTANKVRNYQFIIIDYRDNNQLLPSGGNGTVCWWIYHSRGGSLSVASDGDWLPVYYRWHGSLQWKQAHH